MSSPSKLATLAALATCVLFSGCPSSGGSDAGTPKADSGTSPADSGVPQDAGARVGNGHLTGDLAFNVEGAVTVFAPLPDGGLDPQSLAVIVTQFPRDIICNALVGVGGGFQPPEGDVAILKLKDLDGGLDLTQYTFDGGTPHLAAIDFHFNVATSSDPGLGAQWGTGGMTLDSVTLPTPVVGGYWTGGQASLHFDSTIIDEVGGSASFGGTVDAYGCPDFMLDSTWAF